MVSPCLRIFAFLLLIQAGICHGSSHISDSYSYDVGRNSFYELVQESNDEKNQITDLNSLVNKMVQASKDEKYHMYFFEKDLQQGKKIAAHVQRTTISDIPFLPSQVTKKIPFSSHNFLETLNYFSVKPDSTEANIMRTTIKICENPAIRGETKFCATSKESLINMAASKLGGTKGVEVLSEEVEEETQSQEFTILEGVEIVDGKKVACHKLNYPYAVFYCHLFNNINVYKVPMVGSDGTGVRALGICHKDTSAWGENHFAFKLLKVKPGTPNICHFLYRENLLLVPKN